MLSQCVQTIKKKVPAAGQIKISGMCFILFIGKCGSNDTYKKWNYGGYQRASSEGEEFVLLVVNPTENDPKHRAERNLRVALSVV